MVVNFIFRRDRG